MIDLMYLVRQPDGSYQVTNREPPPLVFVDDAYDFHPPADWETSLAYAPLHGGYVVPMRGGADLDRLGRWSRAHGPLLASLHRQASRIIAVSNADRDRIVLGVPSSVTMPPSVGTIFGCPWEYVDGKPQARLIPPWTKPPARPTYLQ